MAFNEAGNVDMQQIEILAAETQYPWAHPPFRSGNRANLRIIRTVPVYRTGTSIGS